MSRVELGIDFGTTRTVVACADRGNHPVVGFTDGTGDAARWIPSVVAERDGELRFGFDAVAAADDPSFTVVRSFKRLLGGPDAGPPGWWSPRSRRRTWWWGPESRPTRSW